MKAADRYHHFVRWSEEDQLYIGYCPDLYMGGVCHGVNDEQVYAELCVMKCRTVRNKERLCQLL